MKILAIFMTVLMAFAGFDFCKDDGVTHRGEGVQLSRAESGAHCGSDVCNPFCHCVRCPFSVLLSQQQSLILGHQLLTHNFPVTVSGHPVRVSNSVWQPPRLA